MMKKLALLLMSLLASSALAGTPSPTSHARDNLLGQPVEEEVPF